MSLSIQSENNIITIKLANPSAGYSFGIKEADQLSAFLKKLNPKAVQAIVWKTEAGRPFCSGGNLKFYAGLKTKSQGVLANRKIQKSLDLLAQTPVPTIALVEGECLGGGVELLSCFDYVYASPQAVFGLWQRRIGLIFGWGGGRRLSQRLRTLDRHQMSLKAQTVSAYQAQRVGLVDDVLPQEFLQTQAERLIQMLSNLPQESMKALKMLSDKNEQSLFEKLWMNPEHKSVLKKFSQK